MHFPEDEEKIENDNADSQETEVPEAEIRLSDNTTYKIGINNQSETVTNNLEVSTQDTNASIVIEAVLKNNNPLLNINGQLTKNDDNYTISAEASDKDGTFSGKVFTSINGSIGGTQTTAGGEFELDENGSPSHSLDFSATTTIGSSEWTASVHNDRNDTSISINGKQPLLRRDNNPNSEQALYQEQKEQLEQTGDNYSVAIKGGYSNEDAGFYTSNSIMTNLGKGNFLNLKFDISKFKNSVELMADLKKFIFQYTNSNSETEEGIESKKQGIDVSFKDKKNIYTANWFTTSDDTMRNMSLGAKASLNRTQYGEFNSGLNGELQANITQQGYKIGIDGAYNYYGCEHNGTSDYMINSKTNLEKNDNGINFETGLYGAIRFNNCRTIIEPHTIFGLNKNPNGNITRTFNNGAGIYQQLGRNFDDLTAYVVGERVIFNGGNDSNYTQILAGLKKKATKRLTLNAESTWNSKEGFSGSIGGVVNF